MRCNFSSMEIERKFTVKDDSWKGHSQYHYMIRQGYLCTWPACEVRVRIERYVMDNNTEKAYIVVKSCNIGVSRVEVNQRISLDQAEELMSLAKYKVSKIRHNISGDNNLIWEVDEYLDDNQGLTVAEIELPSEDTLFNKPSWLGDEVTYIAEYRNAYLAVHPINSKDNVPDLKTSTTVNELIELCKHNNISQDTHITIGNIDQWNYPILYEFVPHVNKYAKEAEITLNILTEPQDEA